MEENVMTEFCKVSKTDRILTVTINRPERLNALHPPANLELAEVFNEYATDDEDSISTDIMSGVAQSSVVVATSLLLMMFSDKAIDMYV